MINLSEHKIVRNGLTQLDAKTLPEREMHEDDDYRVYNVCKLHQQIYNDNNNDILNNIYKFKQIVEQQIMKKIMKNIN